MIRTTNRRSTTCFNACGHCRQFASDPGLTAFHPALRRRAFSIAALIIALTVETALAAPTAIETDYSDQEILITLPTEVSADTPPVNATTAADRVQAYLTRARAEGDPRYLGYGQALIEGWPDERMTDRLRILSATLDQSLHRFEPARAQLTQVIDQSVDQAQVSQARLTLANLELVQGRYAAARGHCEHLATALPGLIAASCMAQVDARTGNPNDAYETLKTLTRRASEQDITSLLWAEGTLADIAAQLGKPEAEQHWRRVLTLAPDDLYTRTQLADWLLAKGDARSVVTLTDQYEQIDSLAVIRAIAMKQLGQADGDRLAARLEERFREARWRGNLLHQRDLARYALDIAGDTDTALSYAQRNWQDQREPLDTRLLLRAAIAAEDETLVAEVRAWLDRHNQADARYPEERS